MAATTATKKPATTTAPNPALRNRFKGKPSDTLPQAIAFATKQLEANPNVSISYLKDGKHAGKFPITISGHLGSRTWGYVDCLCNYANYFYKIERTEQKAVTTGGFRAKMIVHKDGRVFVKQTGQHGGLSN